MCRKWMILLILQLILLASCERIGITGMVGSREDLDISNREVQEEIKPIVQFANNKLTALKIFREGSFKVSEVIKETLHHTFDGKAYLKSIKNQDKLVMGYYYHIIQKGMALVKEKRKNYIFNVTVWKDLDKRLNLVKNTHYTAGLEQPVNTNRELKVMTYNIWNFNPVWNDRLDKITKEVLRLKPDIVAFQEVRYKFLDDYYKRGPFQVEQISEKLGKKYQYFYHHSMTYLDRNFFHEDEGHAIFSIHPIRETDYIRLSRDLDDNQDDHQRLVARAQVETPLGLVYMHSSHLSLSERSRKRTGLEIWKYLDDTFQQNKIPQIFVGDMNGEPDDIFIRFITGKAKIQNTSGAMIDSWNELYPEQLGLTFPTDRPIKRIDFIFYRGSINAIKASIEGKVAPTHQMASDHLPLIVTFVKK